VTLRYVFTLIIYFEKFLCWEKRGVTEPTLNFVTHDGGDVSAIRLLVVPDSPAIDDVNSSSIAREDGMQHSNPRIQQDLDLWQRIKIIISVHQRICLFPYCPESQNRC